MNYASIDWVLIGGPVEPWTALGLVAQIGADGSARIPFFGTGVLLLGDGAPGLAGFRLSGPGDGAKAGDIDGVPCQWAPAEAPLFAVHPLGAQAIDHVVLATDDLTRTCGAVADVTGAPLKRIREAGTMRQGFHRVGGLIVEVVEMPGADPSGEPGAHLWGVTLTVDDLDAAYELLGPDRLSEPRDAVQPGRQIATVRGTAGLGLPVALMSPHVR